jgi:hypothetical protein
VCLISLCNVLFSSGRIKGGYCNLNIIKFAPEIPLGSCQTPQGHFLGIIQPNLMTFKLPLPNIDINVKVDVSWHMVDGLTLYIDGELVSSDAMPATNEIDYNATWRFLIGRANTDMRHESFANAIFDDVEFWEANRATIESMGFIKQC